METGISVWRVLSQSSALIFSILLILPGCSGGENPRSINADRTEVITRRGITYVDGKPFTGILFSLYQSHDTAFVKQYSQGKQEGIQREYFQSGKMKSIRLYRNNWKVGEHQGWHSNGARAFVYHFANDEFDGNQKEWSERGQLLSDLNYQQGHEQGKQTVWYEDGKIKANYIIRNNRRYGLLGTKNCINTTDSLDIRPDVPAL